MDKQPVSIVRVIIKALLLFAVINLLFARADRMSYINGLSIYNHLVPARERFPYGEKPQLAYNLSLYSIEAMFETLSFDSKVKPPDEFRVLVLGDSSIWGTLLKPEETLTGQLNAMQLVCSGKNVRFYNLGYPTLSLTKDLMILKEGLTFDYYADLIIWPMTLESFPRSRQLESPLAANNPSRILALVERYRLNLDTSKLKRPTFLERTIVGQRRPLADLIRLQLYGFLWASTGVDQYYPPTYEKAAVDLKDDPSYNTWQPPDFPKDSLAWDVLAAGMRMAGNTPVVLINEPMLISQGQNSNIRYNAYYPRWAYDQYRQLWQNTCKQNGWNCLDAWDLVPATEFTNTAIHLSPRGEELFAEKIAADLLPNYCTK
ncbi:MAG: hypothetical protein HGA53_01720 [Anaerolineaceae bacterium]|nr:hypothetical protein [Anaerolineaceae bacterium]